MESYNSMNSISKTSDSLKEYYVDLHKLYNNAVNMLSAINQSLTTSGTEVEVSILDSDNTFSTVRIPSFIHLENRIEELDNKLDALVHMPESGEAWFNNNANMYKLELVNFNNSPVTPLISPQTSNMGFGSTPNTFIKDLVSPKTYLRIGVNNIPNNIEELYIKKLVLNSSDIFNSLQSMNISTYNDYMSAIYNLRENVDYELYDSTLRLPTKFDKFNSEFQIVNFNPNIDTAVYVDTNTNDSEHTHYIYELQLSTLTYTDAEDYSITYTLKEGDLLTMKDVYVLYKVKKIEIYNENNIEEYYVTLEEVVGHTVIQPYFENQNMILYKYDNLGSKTKYVNVPLEENQFIVLFIGCIYNNQRSKLSDGIMVDMASIYMVDENGNTIYDINKNPINYLDYYDEQCKNIGDLIDGISKVAYPQLSNYTPGQLNDLQDGAVVQDMLNSIVNDSDNLRVVKINSHLIDDVTSENIISLHEQKSKLNSQLTNINASIDSTYNQLITTDFSQDLTITQEKLKSQLDIYYNERQILEKQLFSIVDNINILSGEVHGLEKSKYRIRGVLDLTTLIDYLHETYGNKLDIIGIDCQYKYKSVNTDTNDIKNINSNVFTDWNSMPSIERERHLVFDANTGLYSIQYDNYNSLSNVIKWNQIDIPISQGEDVVIRVRVKYNIGNPYINIYSNWTDEFTVVFPVSFTEQNEISSILAVNENDTISARFNGVLVNDGYEEHINNKIIDNSNIYYHMPDNIYSGFNTPENKLISLKDYLTTLTNTLDKYSNIVDTEMNSEYKVYLEYDNKTVELFTHTTNNITINIDTNGINDTFNRLNMNLVIKNTGNNPVKLYSIFPGFTDSPLLLNKEQFYQEYIKDYERVPMIVGTSQDPFENIDMQTLGQWIYFRQNNPYTLVDIYFNSPDMELVDVKETNKIINETPLDELDSQRLPFNYHFDTYIAKDQSQALLGYRDRGYYNDILKKGNNAFSKIIVDPDTHKCEVVDATNIVNINGMSTLKNANFYKYTSSNCDYVLMYEHFKNKDDKYLTNKNSLLEFVKNTFGNNYGLSKMNGAFLIPSLNSHNDILCDEGTNDQFKVVQIGKSISVPLLYEYFLDGTETKSITKTLAFDLRPILSKEPEHYMLNITCKTDENIYTYTNEDTDAVLIDELTNS